jgi:hypothetical protein
MSQLMRRSSAGWPRRIGDSGDERAEGELSPGRDCRTGHLRRGHGHFSASRSTTTATGYKRKNALKHLALGRLRFDSVEAFQECLYRIPQLHDKRPAYPAQISGSQSRA